MAHAIGFFERPKDIDTDSFGLVAFDRARVAATAVSGSSFWKRESTAVILKALQEVPAMGFAKHSN